MPNTLWGRKSILAKKQMEGLSNTNGAKGKGIGNGFYRTLRNTIYFFDRKKLYHMVSKRHLYVKKMMEHGDLFIAPSQFLRDEYIKFGIPAEKYSILIMGLIHPTTMIRANMSIIQIKFSSLLLAHR